jgi:hypothetical protein
MLLVAQTTIKINVKQTLLKQRLYRQFEITL